MMNLLGLVEVRGASVLLLMFHFILFPANIVEGKKLNHAVRKLEETTATYEYQIEFNTTTYMNAEEALDKLDADSKKRLEEELGEEEDLAFEIASKTVDTCATPMTTSDMCFEAQSVVTITSTSDNTQDVYVEQATVEQVQKFMDTFNEDNPDVHISFVGPFYISSDLTIDIAPVQTTMDDMAKEVFEFVLVDHLEEYFRSIPESEIVVSNLSAEVLFEILSAIQRARQRRLQPTTGKQQNRVSIFVAGTCNRCLGRDNLISDAANKINYDAFMNDLKKEGSDAGTDYFDGLDRASYARSTLAGIDKPVVNDVGDVPDDKKQPFWIWITLGIAVVIVGGMFALLYSRKRAAIFSESKGDFASAVENNNGELGGEDDEEVDGIGVANESDGSEQDPLEAEVSVHEYEVSDSELNRCSSRPGKYGEDS